MKTKAITTTIIFEGFALNRDENLAKNILSIKTIRRFDKTFSFLGKNAMRHYLFKTLNRGYDWRPSSVTMSKSKSGNTQAVLQFDLTKNDIINSEELDAFGYMYTIGGQGALTRKATVHITKAVSLEPYRGDLALYSNHDLVKRGQRQGINCTPDLFHKQEHNSFFKVSFTIDCEKLGTDEWFFDEYNEKEKKGIIKGNKEKFVKDFSYYLTNPEKALISLEKVNNKVKATFKIPQEEKKKRILQILNSIKDGFSAYTSESNTIIPLFIISAGVRVPSPIFFPYINVYFNTLQVTGIEDCLANGWIDTKVYIKESDRLKARPKDIEENKTKITNNWDEFLKELELQE